LFSLQNVDVIAGIESRGFILAAALAKHSGKGFIPLRKAGKLPPPTVSESYALEYGSATLELAPGQGRVIILDDVLATGGTLQAGIKLCERAGYEVCDVGVLINLAFLNTMQFNKLPVKSLIIYS
jgi:adenine phosphoribosyltransferase